MGFLAFLIPFFVYLTTTQRTIPLGDSGEFILGACGLGIGHPPGFPIIMMLGNLFCGLPFGSFAFRVNLMSGFFGALTCLWVFLILKRLGTRGLVALTAALALAFSKIFWSQSVVAEVYTLATFFMGAITYTLIRYRELFNKSWLWGAAFVWGLSLTNHWPLMVVATPGWIFLALWNLPQRRLLWRTLPALLVFAGIGLLPYLYLPLRAAQDPLLNWGDPDSWRRFFIHVLRLTTTESRPYWEPMASLRLFSTFIKEVALKDFALLGTLLALFGFYQFRQAKPAFVYGTALSWLLISGVTLWWVRIDRIGVDLYSVFSAFATLGFFQALLLGLGLESLIKNYFWATR